MIEIMSLKSEQDNLRAEFSEARCKTQTRVKSTDTVKRAANALPSRERARVSSDTANITSNAALDKDDDDDWGNYCAADFVFTQDSQGVTVVTRETPAHKIPRKVNAGIPDNPCVPIEQAAVSNPRKPQQYPVTHRLTNPASGTQRSGSDVLLDNGIQLKPPQTQRPNISGPVRGQMSTATRHVAQNGKNSGNPSGGVGITRRRVTAQEMFDGTGPQTEDDDGTLVKRQKLDLKNDAIGISEIQSNDNKNDNVTVNAISSSDSDDSMGEHSKSADNESFAEKAAKNVWKTVTYSKSPEKKKGTTPTITGSEDSGNKELYVQGLSCKNFRTHKELEGAVRVYCESRKIKVHFQRIVAYKNNRKTVGCRIVIDLDDVDKVYARGFWPKGVHIREWYDDKPTEKDRYFASGSESDGNH